MVFYKLNLSHFNKLISLYLNVFKIRKNKMYIKQHYYIQSTMNMFTRGTIDPEVADEPSCFHNPQQLISTVGLVVVTQHYRHPSITHY